MKEDSTRYVMAIFLQYFNLFQSNPDTSAYVSGDTVFQDALGHVNTAGFVSQVSAGSSETPHEKMKGSARIIRELQSSCF